jgi:hypothetical protein
MPELYPEDQERVNKVLNEGIYKVDRKPFAFWGLMAVLIGCLVLITLVGYGLTLYFENV